MNNTFHKVIVRIVFIAIIATVWVLFLRGWKFGELDSFVNAFVDKVKWILIGIGLLSVLLVRNKYV